MIKETELRIGSWVQTKAKGEFQVESIYEQGVNLDISGDYYGGWVCDYDGYFENDWYGERRALLEPISITEEWLEKFGFKKEIRASIQTSVKDVFNWSYNGMWIIKFSEADGYCNYQSSIIVRYVHELQNAHFIFFGKELTIQEKPLTPA